MLEKNILNKTLRNSLWYFMAELLVPILGLVMIPVYTRLFLPEEYGIFVIITTTLTFLTIFGTKWIDSASLRFYESYKLKGEEKNYLTSYFFVLALSLFTISIFACTVFTLFNSTYFGKFSSLVGLTIAIFIIHSVFTSGINILRVDQKAKAYSFFHICYVLSKTLGGVLLALIWYKNVASLLWGWLIFGSLIIPFLMFKLELLKKIRFSYYSSLILKKITTYGLPFIVSGFSWTALTLLDRYILQYFRGSGEVGIYNIGYLISNNSIAFFASAIMLSAYPSIVSAWEKNKELAKDLVIRLIRIHLLFCLPALFGISILSKQIVGLLATEEYLSAYFVIPLIASGAFVQGLLSYTTKSFVLFEKTTFYAIFVVSGVILNIVLNLILIPNYGFLGAGLSMILTYSLMFVISLIINNYKFRMNWFVSFNVFFKILIASTIMGFMVYALSFFLKANFISLILLVGVGILIYSAMLIVLKEIQKEEVIGFFEESKKFLFSYKKSKL